MSHETHAAAVVPNAASTGITSDIATEYEPTERVRPLFIVLFGLVNFGLYFTVLMPALFSLPYKVTLIAPDDRVAVLGAVVTVGAIVQIILGPIAGALSDRTRTRIGRRRPWLIAGILILALGSTNVALAESVPMLLIGWVIVTVGGAACSAAVVPIVAERIPESQRGLMSAIIGVATQLGGVFGYTVGGLLTGNLVLLFLVPVITLAVFGAIYMLVFADRSVPIPHTTVGQAFRALVFNPLKHRDFSLVWLGKLLMQVGLAFLTTYQLYFLLDRLGFTPEQAGANLALVGGVGLLVTMTFAVVSGTLSDRLRRRKVFIYIAAVLAAVGMALMAITDGFGLFFAAVLFILGSAGMFGSVDVAMASDLVPDRAQAGRWMAIYHLAATLSTAIAPLVGAALLAIGTSSTDNYTALFLAGAAVALGTAIVTIFVKGVR
jgi:MFS family permease